MPDFDIDQDFRARQDAFTLVDANEIKKDQGRIVAARLFVKDQQEKFAQMERDLPDVKERQMNNSVRNSKMKVRMDHAKENA